MLFCSSQCVGAGLIGGEGRARGHERRFAIAPFDRTSYGSIRKKKSRGNKSSPFPRFFLRLFAHQFPFTAGSRLTTSKSYVFVERGERNVRVSRRRGGGARQWFEGVEKPEELLDRLDETRPLEASNNFSLLPSLATTPAALPSLFPRDDIA